MRSSSPSSPLVRASGFGLSVAALACALVLPGEVLAGPPEVLAGISLHPRNPASFVIRYENALGGLLLTEDGGKTFRIRPGMTFTRSGVREEAPVLMLADGTVLLGGTDGLSKTDARGCAPSALTGKAWAPAIARHPADPAVALFVTSQGAAGLRTGLWRREASGAVTPLGRDDSQGDGADFNVTGMLVSTSPSASAQLRIVQTGTRITRADAGQTSRPVLRTSDDLGQSFREHDIPSPVGAGSPRLLAVDPSDLTRMLVALPLSGTPDPADLVLLTRDDGQTFLPYIEGITRVGQVAQAADGRLWLGDMGDPSLPTPSGGLWFTSRLGETPERVLVDRGITCVAHDASSDKLWLCQDYELDLFEPSTRALCRAFELSDVAGFVSCEAEDLRQSVAAREQLCSGFCGALHFADAPLCSVYDDASALCGRPALAYDRQVGWESPAGAGARCEDFAAPTADVSDAGASVDAGAVPEAGSTSPVDASFDASPQSASARSSDGCALAPGGTRVGLGELLSLLALASLLRLRMRRTSLATLLLLGLIACGDEQTDRSDVADAGFAPSDAGAREDDVYPAATCAPSIPSSPLALVARGMTSGMSLEVLQADFDPPRKYHNDWVLELRDAAGAPVVDASFSKVRTWMPVHAHNGKFVPLVTPDPARPGVYAFGGVHFTMTGPWQLQLEVTAGSLSDRFVLDVCVGD